LAEDRSTPRIMHPKRKIIPDNAPFTTEEAEWLDHFFTQMSPEQATWLNGFVSGFQAYQLTGAAMPSPARGIETARPTGKLPVDMRPAPPSSVSSKPKVTILFGSESGNAESLAVEAKKRVSKAGFKVNLLDLVDTNPSELVRESFVLVFISTWGEGEPPQRGVKYHEKLMAADAPRLDGLKFAVLGLGDTSYEQFCQAGKDFDARFEALGGTRFLDRADCDVDYESMAQAWIDRAVEALAQSSVPSRSQQDVLFEVVSGEASSSTSTQIEYGKKNPFPASLKERVVLNGTGSAKETLHLEFSLEGSGMTYEPGDSLAVLPVNCAEVVTDIIKAAGLTSEVPVTNKKGESVDLFSHIMRECDATVLSKVLIEKYQEIAQHANLADLLKPENKPKLQEYIWGREIVDLLIEFPVRNLTPDNLVMLLRRLPPRLYSIASSQRMVEEEVHLTVAAVRYYTHRRHRKGVCSTFLADRVDIGGEIPVYVQPNKHFKLPESSDTPMIMVGPGTGVAPFRAFLQDRQATGAKGRNWLFFGDQHFSYDFLYQLEWQEFHKDGVLTRMDAAFSRDTPDKVYVQHRMLEQANDLYAWLQEGAAFYVCGDASRMAPDVHAALKTILQQQGAMTEDTAEAYLELMKKEKRYQRDVY
jgi:sulfite reductase (NADPH) flavoprotein alpha-component